MLSAPQKRVVSVWLCRTRDFHNKARISTQAFSGVPCPSLEFPVLLCVKHV